jgi:hypothetical protein
MHLWPHQALADPYQPQACQKKQYGYRQKDDIIHSLPPYFLFAYVFANNYPFLYQKGGQKAIHKAIKTVKKISRKACSQRYL